ncbi:hypothetical protein BC938DRAFT_477093, partial [Jimgerdemannia flammicorona]
MYPCWKVAWSDTALFLFEAACKELDKEKKRRQRWEELEDLRGSTHFKRARNQLLASEHAEDLVTAYFVNQSTTETSQTEGENVVKNESSEADGSEKSSEADGSENSCESEGSDIDDSGADDTNNVDMIDDEGDVGLAPALRKILLSYHAVYSTSRDDSLSDVFGFEDKTLVKRVVCLLSRTDRDALLQNLQGQDDYHVPEEVQKYQEQLHNANSLREMRQAQRTAVISPDDFDPVQHADLLYLEEIYSNFPVNILNDPSQNERSIVPKIVIPMLEKLFRMHSDLFTTHWLEKQPLSTKDDPNVNQRTKLADRLEVYCMNIIAKRLYQLWKICCIPVPRMPCQILDEFFHKGLRQLLKLKHDVIETAHNILKIARSATDDDDLAFLLKTPTKEKVSDFLSQVNPTPTKQGS